MRKIGTCMNYLYLIVLYLSKKIYSCTVLIKKIFKCTVPVLYYVHPTVPVLYLDCTCISFLQFLKFI